MSGGGRKRGGRLPFETLSARSDSDYVHLWDAQEESEELLDAFVDYVLELDRLAIFAPHDSASV